MGFLSFPRIFKYCCLVVFALAAALTVAVIFANPATARETAGGGVGDTDKSWDTDNLVFTSGGYSYTARSFAIPHLTPAQRGSHVACQSGVVGGFFQLDPSVRNDLPVLEVTVSGDTARKSERAAVTCTEFVNKQKAAVDGANSSGYYLDSEGILRKKARLPAHVTVVRDGLGYEWWSRNGGFNIAFSSRYADRVDYYEGSGANRRNVFRSPGVPTVPSAPAVNTRLSGGNLSWSPNFSTYGGGITATTAQRLRNWTGLCLAGFHPRGEDAVRRIGAGTGRTLSSLTTRAKARTADKHWCRSDARKRIWYSPQPVTGTTCGTAGAPPCPDDVTIPDREFQSYGRVGCYFTATGWDTTSYLRGTQKNTCSYIYPIPECTENGNKQPISPAQLDSWHVRRIDSPQVFPFASDGTTECKTKQETTTTTTTTTTTVPNGPTTTTTVPPPDFTDDPCVTVILEIYENRVKSSDATPGIQASHRTIAADTTNPAYDLDVTAPHSSTASPPRDTSDPSGCADRTESRADHGTAASAARKNTGAAVDGALPTSSAAGVSTHPPHSKGFTSAGTDYTGAVKNIAHRFASDVAEKFAELVLEILEGRRLVFQDYIDSYEARVDAAISAHSSYSANIRTGNENSANAYANLSLEEMRQNALERQRAKYVNDRKAYLDSLKAALTNAETQYLLATNSTNLTLGAVAANGCVDSYNNASTGKIATLKNTASTAETAFPSTSVTRSVVLSNKAYDVTGSASTTQTGGTAFFERKYNALSLLSYENLVPAYNVTASPPSDARPADSSLTWTLGTWSGASRSYSCAHLSDHFLNTYQGALRCLKQEERTASPSESCPSAVPEGATSWSVVQVTLGKRCVASDSDGDEVESVSVTYSCSSGWTLTTRNVFQVICTRWFVVGNLTPQHRDTYTRTDRYSNVVSGTVAGTLQGTTGKKANFSRTYTGSRVCEYATGTMRPHNPASRASRTAPACGTITHNLATGTSAASARAVVVGTAQSNSVLPADAVTTSTPAPLASITEASLLGKLHPDHLSRNNLEAASAANRNTAAANLGSLTQTTGTIVSPSASAAAINSTAGGTSVYAAGFVPSGNTAQRTAISRAATAYINQYAAAYDAAYSAALSDMGSTAATTT